MIDFVRFVLTGLVEHPEQVQINEIEGDTTTILEITVAKSDMGHVIGKNGKVINAIRELVRASTKRKDKKVVIEVI
jgi:predicted RNA-binding protein YlqC (UPF0109 family)